MVYLALLKITSEPKSDRNLDKDNVCNPLDPSKKDCNWTPFGNPNSRLCGACNYPQRVNPQCLVQPVR